MCENELQQRSEHIKMSWMQTIFAQIIIMNVSIFRLLWFVRKV